MQQLLSPLANFHFKNSRGSQHKSYSVVTFPVAMLMTRTVDSTGKSEILAIFIYRM